MTEQLTGIDWLTAVEPIEDDDDLPHGSGRIDFVLGAALAGVNLFVSTGLILVWVLRAAGLVAAAFLHQTTAAAQSPAQFEILVTGALVGLAVGVSGFAICSWKRLPSYYWPLFGIAIALGSTLLASRS